MRGELLHFERTILLDTLDTSWKDHLYAMDQLRDTINSWGQDAVNIQFDEHPGDEPSSRLIDYLNNRLGQSGSSAAP